MDQNYLNEISAKLIEGLRRHLSVPASEMTHALDNPDNNQAKPEKSHSKLKFPKPLKQKSVKHLLKTRHLRKSRVRCEAEPGSQSSKRELVSSVCHPSSSKPEKRATHKSHKDSVDKENMGDFNSTTGPKLKSKLREKLSTARGLKEQMKTERASNRGSHLERVPLSEININQAKRRIKKSDLGDKHKHGCLQVKKSTKLESTKSKGSSKSRPKHKLHTAREEYKQ